MSEGPSVYIVIQEQESQVHWYPLNQLQTLHITGNLPALPAGAQDQRNLREGTTLGFIISGSLSVASEREPNSLHLLRSYIVTNIFSAITSVIGTCLFITEVIINSPYNHVYTRVLSGRVTSGMLFIFSLLEFWIAFTCAISGYQRNKSLMKA
ncbi:membrane-spanning 4-domains subfamily A member 8-like [Sturnira hondurensis]|uniref:membrane-spanning 4-domains subfamily A member 8-like n=1 Tax=Sturnira hondurensis TaxID=192404 RepID=UPI00187AB25A|nr:membrane-spanning 4-domains subfamily A member 8-like [Sturnira hondurensis]